MTGAAETRLEKIIKPININPRAFGIAVAGLTLSFIDIEIGNSSLDSIISFSQIAISALGGGAVGIYLYSTITYFGLKTIIKRHGVSSYYANLYLNKYSSRHPFYTAAVKHGYRDEVIELMKDKN